MWDFFRKHGLIFSEVFWYMERSNNLEKNISHNRAKKFIFLSVDTFFIDVEKSNSKRLFLKDSKCKSITRGWLIKDKNR